MALSFLQDTSNSGLRQHRHVMKESTPSERSDSRSGHCDSPTSLIDASHLSPPLSNGHMSSHAFPGLPHPLQFYPGNFAASQTAALLAAAGGNPLHLHATLAAGNFQHELFSAWHSPVSPPNSNRSKNNNNHVTSSTTAIGKKAFPRRKKKALEMTPITEPLSPPTSGSPPSGEISSGKSSGEKDASNRDKVFTCGICKRSFGYKHVLQNHERTHTGEKPFECQECHKRFTRDHHLKTHMRLHTGEKPYHCTHCDRQFVQVANLRRHLRVHTGERPYGCDLCTSRFSDSNQLKAHMLIHKGEKPFGCEICQGRFRRRHHMIHHKCPGNMDEHKGTMGQKMDVDNAIEADIDDMDEELEIDDEEEEIRRGLIIAHNNNKVEKKPRTRKTQDIRRVIRMPSAATAMISKPILSSSLQLPASALVLPVQTEPEDLSMSTGTGSMFASSLHRSHHSHSSGDSPMSRSPSSEADEELDDEEDIATTSTSLFLQHRHPKFRRHLHHNGHTGTAPVS